MSNERIDNLIERIWMERKIPRDWGLGVKSPVHKKNDKSVCENYRGITLLSIVYKVLAKILAWRLEPLAENIVGEYQCGFRRKRATLC